MTSVSSQSEIPNVDKLIRRFNVFLDDHKVEGKNVEHSHTAFGPPWGKYMIPDDEYDDFIKMYSEIYSKTPLHLTERPREVGPIILDIDFKFDNKHKTRQYTLEDIVYTIEKFNKVIKKYYSINKEDVKSFVFEKKNPTHDSKNDEYKDGWHIVWPYVSASTAMRYLIREEVMDTITEEGGFDHIKYVNTFEDVVDKCIIDSNGWMMYGSKKYNGFVYKLTHVYRYDTTKEEDISKYKTKELPKILSNRQYTVNDELKFRNSINRVALNKKLDKILRTYAPKNKQKSKKKKQQTPLEGYNSSDTDISYDEGESSDDQASSSSKDKGKSKSSHNRDGGEGAPAVEELTPEEKLRRLAAKLVGIMSKERANDFHKWIRVGWALKTVDERLLEAFKAFSKKSPKKYDRKYCEKVWDEARDDGYTIKALHRWASEDNPKRYAEIMRGSINDLVAEAETGTENDIAKLIFELYKHCFVCASIKHNIWYEFQGHRWVEVESGYTLKNKISDDLTKEFAAMNSVYYAQASVANGQDRDILLKKGDNVMKIMHKLKKSGFKRAVIEECTNLFYNKRFEESLDSNPDLIGFDNGVYDLKNMCFREGVPEDYVTFSTGYDWVEYKDGDPIIADMEDFFCKVMVEKPMREYILTLLASYLDGYTKQQKFILWTGGGGNGKSKTVTFFGMAFGDYCDTLPITILTRKQGSASAASPEIAKLRGKRFVCFQEPESDDQIYVGRMKEYTGGDKIHARPMYRDPVVFKPQFKLLLTCNKLPYIPSNDGGTWRRLRVSPWESEFVDFDKKGLVAGKPPTANQFPKDYDLDEKLEKWKKVFMWYLVTKYYPKFIKEGLVEPPKVLEFTNKYQKDSDIYFEFLSEVLVTTKHKKDYEQMSVIYNFFKDWYRECYATSKCPSKKDLAEYMDNHDYVCTNGYVYGVKFANDDNIEDSDLDE